MEEIEDQDQFLDDNQLLEIQKIKQQSEKQYQQWAELRRPSQNINFSEDLDFMQIDCDYIVSLRKDPLIRMFGLTRQKNSILVLVHGFEPYFYIQAPEKLSLDEATLRRFKESLNGHLQNIKSIKDKDAIQRVEVCQKESVRNYKGENGKADFLKVVCKLPAYVATIRGWLKGGRVLDGLELHSLTFESNMPFALRFMIDRDIVGMGWVRLNADKYRLCKKPQSLCQMEFEVDFKDCHHLPIEQYGTIVPLRIFSFDIECAAQRGFPQEDKDPVIQIGCILKEHNEDNELARVIFVHKECENIPGAIVKSYETEKEMLQQFEIFLQAVDPDFITGYNIQNFDFPYLLKRAQHLKVSNFGHFGRLSLTPSRLKDGKFLSKAMGMRDTKEINIDGRIQLDMLMHMMREHKLSSFSLNNVSFQFLKQQKEDVHHSIIYSLQYGDQATPETRKRIAVYCLKDCHLPLQLIQKLMCIYNYSEMARVTGVPINYLFMRGQQIKVASQLYRKAKLLDYVIPTENFSQASEDKYEGAFVLEPVRNYYKVPIATLDFASLYPSIMMAHNLCYTTLIKTNIDSLTEEQCTVAPKTNARFVKASVRKGLLPQILEELITARKRAKVELANESDPLKRAVLDGRQLALKISANSVYGFTGAQIGQLPCLDISASVTAFGRQMITQTQSLVEEKYCKANGYEHDVEIVYGDTDSVMVKFGVSSVEEAMKLGREAASYVSQHFISPIKLEFEKVYYPYLLMNRKRYAGLLWTKPEKYDKIDTKGIESVRRDNCFLIRKMITQILQFILIEKDEKKAIEFTKQQVALLYQNKVDISDLVITKSLNVKKNGKEQDENEKNQNNKQSKQNNNKIMNTYKQKQAHVVLAEKMQKRDETNAPAAGDRIPYIMIEGSKGSKNFENAEDPIEVLQKGLPIDFDYYVQKQLKQPLTRIFEYIISNTESLFAGEHTRNRYIPKVSAMSALGKFVVKKNTCMSCKKVLQDNSPLCEECRPKAIELITVKTLQTSQLQEKFQQFWTQCQRCASQLHQDVLCSNRDCEIFYKRRKVQQELQDGWNELEKFADW